MTVLADPEDFVVGEGASMRNIDLIGKRSTFQGQWLKEPRRTDR
jgi:hypothetical protein